MTPEEAAVIDHVMAGEPKDDVEKQCAYWKTEGDRLWRAAPKTGGATYAVRRRDGLCKSAYEAGQAKTIAATGPLSATGPYSGELTVEKDGEKFTGIVVSLEKSGRPAGKTEFWIRTVPGWTGKKKALHALTEDSGSVTIPADYARERLFGWYEPASTPGKFRILDFIISVGGQSIPVGAPLKPLYTSWVKDDVAAKKAISDDEIASGKCKADRGQNMQNVALGLKQLFDAMSTGGDVFRFDSSEVLVATDKGTAAEIDTSMGGEMHVFVVGFDAVALDVTSGGYAVSTKSPYETPVKSTTQGQTDSRVVQVNAGATLQTRVVGAGCAVVAAVRKL